MKKIILFILITFNYCQAQRTDNIWVMGYHYFPTFVPGLNFYYNFPDTIAISSPIELFGACTSVSNNAGDLKLYSNGIVICNNMNDTLPGSINFNYDATYMGPPYNGWQLPSQSIILLPRPGFNDQYTAFHVSLHIFNSDAQPIKLCSSIIDMNANNGNGQMTVKNQTIINDTLLYNTMQATRHANGRDWWIIIHKWKSSDFEKVLLTPYSNIISSQTVGPYFNTNLSTNGQSVFSPDGTRFATLYGDSNRVDLYDFDRCTGDLLFRESIYYNNPDVLTGCSFSPDSRLFYLSTLDKLYQYDASVYPCSSTAIHIADFDGAANFNLLNFLRHRMGPDGKIYICTPPSTYLHVISDPDQVDTLCVFQQHAVKLKSWHAGSIPEFPNYRLGPLTGSPCDSINFTALHEIELPLLNVFPNPASDFITLNYSLKNTSSGLLEILDVSGRIVYHQLLSYYSNTQTVNITQFEAGIYTINVQNQELSQKTKIVIIH